MYVLGIESSCDDTALAVYSAEKGLLAEARYSPLQMHAEHGGIVPELVSRDHVQNIVPMISKVMQETGLGLSELNGIAYTKGPGLIGALLVGATFAKSLALALQIPAIGIHHLEGHLLAPLLEQDAPHFPFLALLVSGGHTMLLEAKALGEYSILGESLDDAAGEAFDKTARLLGLPYPGGPAIAALARQGNPKAYHFPRPMLHKPGFDFSFSGLKTHTRQTFEKSAGDEQAKADIARAFEDAVVDSLVVKCQAALMAHPYQQLVVAGGVSANQRLRQALQTMAEQLQIKLYFPRPSLCMDNGAMIAYAGFLRLSMGQREDLAISPRARWPIDELTPPE